MEIESFVIAWITIFALAMIIISVKSYWRCRINKILFVSGAFVIFFIKGIILTIALFYEIISSQILWLLMALFDLGILILLFAVTVKR